MTWCTVLCLNAYCAVRDELLVLQLQECAPCEGLKCVKLLELEGCVMGEGAREQRFA